MLWHRAVIWILIIAPDFLKGKSAAQLHSQGSLSIFSPLVPPPPRQSRHCDWQWCSVAVVPLSRLFLLLLPRCSTSRSPPPLCRPTHHPLFHCVLYFASVLSHTDVWCWCGKHPLHFQWSSLENRGGSRRPLTQGSRWGVRWSWAPNPAPHGVRAWLRQHIIHILKASWTDTKEHKESKETYHPRPHQQLTSDSFGMSKFKLGWIAVIQQQLFSGNTSPFYPFSRRIKHIMWKRSWPVSHIVYSGENNCTIFASADTIVFPPFLFAHGAVV